MIVQCPRRFESRLNLTSPSSTHRCSARPKPTPTTACFIRVATQASPKLMLSQYPRHILADEVRLVATPTAAATWSGWLSFLSSNTWRWLSSATGISSSQSAQQAYSTDRSRLDNNSRHKHTPPIQQYQSHQLEGLTLSSAESRFACFFYLHVLLE